MQDVVKLVSSELRGAWRYRWRALAVAWAVCTLGWLAVYFTPDKYEASSRFYVDTSSALAPFFRNLSVEMDVDQQFDHVKQLIVGSETLLKLDSEHDLDIQATTTNQLNAQATEGMINFAKWADYEAAKNAGSDTMDLSDMEQMAAWLYVNDRKDYDSFTNAWKTMAGVQGKPSATGYMTDTYSLPGYEGLAWSDQEQTNIQNYVKQLETVPKVKQYGDFASTPAPYVTDTQGNAVNVYTGVIMVGDQGPTGGKY